MKPEQGLPLDPSRKDMLLAAGWAVSGGQAGLHATAGL